MMHDRLTIAPHPNHAHLVDHLVATLGVKNDAALARTVGLSASAVSRMRHGKLPITPTVLLTLHDGTGLSIAELRERAIQPQ